MLLFLITACSVDENSEEPSVSEKESKVIDLFESFSKNVVNSPEYTKFIKELQSVSSSKSTEEELDYLEQEFLSQQSREFVVLYYYVLELDLSEDELRNIVIEYVDNTESKNRNWHKSDNDDCVSAGETSRSSLLGILATIFCNVIND